MENLSSLGEFFLLSLALGVGAFSIIANSTLTGAGFIKLISSVIGVSLVLALSTQLSSLGFWSLSSTLYVVSLVATLVVYLWHQDRKSPLMYLMYLLQNIPLLAVMFIFENKSPSHFLFALSSTALLGIIVYAMILGHWYLVVPGLTVKPLKIAISILWPVLLIKFTVALSYVYNSMEIFTYGSHQGLGYMFNWIMFSMRVGWGYVIIFIMSLFVWKLVKMRSIQSATGIFYAMTFFVLIGELVSSFLFFEYGMMI